MPSCAGFVRKNGFRLDMCRTADPAIYSIPVDSVSDKLGDVVVKHCANYQAFDDHNHIAQHTAQAFERVASFVNEFYKDRDENENRNGKLVILDSGCGQGLSTLVLAKLHPDVPIIGIDRSISRLSRSDAYASHKIEEESKDEESLSSVEVIPRNVILVRAELSDFWTLVGKESDWVIKAHYILYPNPYPKAKHLKRRFHGQPVFPMLLAFGGNLVVRSNWNIYCKEMLLGIEIAFEEIKFPSWYKCTSLFMDEYRYKYNLSDQKEGIDLTSSVLGEGIHESGSGAASNDKGNSVPMTHFERKYMSVGLNIYNTVASFSQITPEQRKEILTEMR